jgi:hypothetical protein
MKLWIPAITLAIGLVLLLIPEDETVTYDCRFIDYIDNAPETVVEECHKLLPKHERIIVL